MEVSLLNVRITFQKNGGDFHFSPIPISFNCFTDTPFCIALHMRGWLLPDKRSLIFCQLSGW